MLIKLKRFILNYKKVKLDNNAKKLIRYVTIGSTSILNIFYNKDQNFKANLMMRKRIYRLELNRFFEIKLYKHQHVCFILYFVFYFFNILDL